MSLGILYDDSLGLFLHGVGSVLAKNTHVVNRRLLSHFLRPSLSPSDTRSFFSSLHTPFCGYTFRLLFMYLVILQSFLANSRPSDPGLLPPDYFWLGLEDLVFCRSTSLLLFAYALISYCFELHYFTSPRLPSHVVCGQSVRCLIDVVPTIPATRCC